MLRRRLFWPVRRPLLRGALVGGLGYLIGRRAGSRTVGEAESHTVSGRLDELRALRAAGKVSDAEYEAKRSEIIGEL